MARKTKEEALATRCRILDAAEHLFQRDGVSATSLNDIAVEAGVTRGAIYWHFADKADLFDAMLRRTFLPMHVQSDSLLARPDEAAPLERVRQHVAAMLRTIATDERVRRVIDITATKVEYVDELTPVREHSAEMKREYVQTLRANLECAQRLGLLPAAVMPEHAAIALFALIDGLIRHWVLSLAGFDLRAVGIAAADRLLAGFAAAD